MTKVPILIKDKSGKIYKRMPDGMIVKAGLHEIKEIIDSNTPIPYTNIIKRASGSKD